MDSQPIVCHTCTGVLLAADSRTYTPQRGRLILTNGYCACPTAEEPDTQMQQEQGQGQGQERFSPAQAAMVNA
ncbi:hypothetical protein [Streptosporangium sp. NPDC087985]|uniref:hypothetical protein n=1 Tax=Streptosporangium sp. NPDC087985 TaxID=3366196 RepID=UPI00382B542B